MASRSMRGRRIIDDSSSDTDSNDEFPDLKDIAKIKPLKQTEQPTAKNVRRRKLGAIADNPLLRPFGVTALSTPVKKDKASTKKKSTTPQRIELRTRKTKSIVTSLEVDDLSEAGSVQEETIIEDFSGSDFDASQSSNEEHDDDATFGEARQRSPSKCKGLSDESKTRKETHRGAKRSPSPSAQLLAEAMEAEERQENRGSESSSSRGSTENKNLKKKTDGARCSPGDDFDFAEPLSKLRA